jgi:hypothetical protein
MDAHQILSAPGEWDRYYQAEADLDAVLGTPGLPQSFGATVAAAGIEFVQAATRGFFLRTDQPRSLDPVELSAELSGEPRSGVLAEVSAPRRRRARNTATGTHLEVDQIVRGARVVGSEMRVHSDDRGVYAVTGRPLGDIAGRDPGAPPPVINEEALEACAERFDLEGPLRAALVEQVVFPTDSGATWAYEVCFVVPEHSADVRAYLDARDMSLLLSYNISSAVTGPAQVYPVNPLQTPDLQDVTLEGLDDPGNLLLGSAVDVSQAAAQRLARDDSDFRVDPSDPAFDEVQAYHHLWRVRQFFEGLVDGALLQAQPFTPMRAYVNDPASPNNAFYMPSTGELRFGAFGPRSSARSASVVCHEFGHAITDAICGLGRAKRRDTESRGLSEGYSDYFAAALLEDPRLGDYVADKPGGARNCADPSLRFPAGFVGKEHATGSVWAGVLWGLRGQVDSGSADRLAVESTEFLDGSSTFEDALSALHAADDQLFNGANRQAIDDEWNARAPG